MLFRSALLVASAIGAAAAPASHFASVLTASSSAVHSLPVGKTPISRGDMRELGRLAQAVKDLQPLPIPVEQTPLQSRHQRRAHTSRHHSSVLITSDDDEFAALADDVDLNWYISHTPETQTLTLAFSSLPSIDDLLELLASEPAESNATEALVDLPAYLFPPEAVDSFPAPRMHHAYRRALETHGTAALLAVLDLLESPPAAPRSRATVLADYFFGAPPQPAAAARPITHVDITGHGLGAAVGMLTALALHLETAGPAALAYARPLDRVDISATLFGLPRVGDQQFADWVDTVTAHSPGGDDVDSKLRIHRVSSYADTVAHLPARHLDLAHPAHGEIWVGADPRVAYACRADAEGTEADACAAGIPLERTSLLDHAGPFAGVWIGAGACRRTFG